MTPTRLCIGIAAWLLLGTWIALAMLRINRKGRTK